MSELRPLVDLSFERLVEIWYSGDRRTPFASQAHDEIHRRIKADGPIALGQWVFRATEDDSFRREVNPKARLPRKPPLATGRDVSVFVEQPRRRCPRNQHNIFSQ